MPQTNAPLTDATEDTFTSGFPLPIRYPDTNPNLLPGVNTFAKGDSFDTKATALAADTRD
jgi:hypothetical protein